MSDPNNPYGQPQDGGYGYPQQPAGQPGYGYPQQGAYPPPGAYPAQPGYGVAPNAPYGYDPYGRPYSDKSKLTAGLLGVFLGGFGVGRFYTGHTGMAVGQLVVSLVTCGIGAMWGFIDGIVLLAGNAPTDAQGRVLRP